MEYRVVEKINISKYKFKKIGAFFYQEETDSLYFESPWPFPVQLMISDNLSRCLVTPGFLKLPFILKGWINLDILLREIELLKLVEQGKVLMHASCVDNTLIVGFPNAGKTYQTYKSVKDGGTLISEEYTIISKGVDGWRADPYKPVMRTCFSRRTIKDCEIEMSFKDWVCLWLAEVRAYFMPFMFEGAIWKEIPVAGHSRQIKKITYGSLGVEIKNWKTFAILCENEFPFMASEFLQAYAVVKNYDILGVQEKQRSLIKEFVGSVYPCSAY